MRIAKGRQDSDIARLREAVRIDVLFELKEVINGETLERR
jgi:hypothetical protein